MHLVFRHAIHPDYPGQRKAVVLDDEGLRKDDHVVVSLGSLREIQAWIDEHPGSTSRKNIEKVEAVYGVMKGVYEAVASYGRRPRKTSAIARWVDKAKRAYRVLES